MSEESDLLVPRTPSFRLEGKRALVSGGSRGLGFASAAALAEAGAAVALLSRSRQRAEQAARALTRKGGYQAEGYGLDVLEGDRIEAFLTEREAKGEGFDILVNNAGTNEPQHFLHVERASYDRIMDLNLRAAFFLAQAVAKRMRSAGRCGSIINISSQMGRVGGARRTVYCAAKHGLEGLTKAMALDLAGCGIRVNALAPTFIETDLTQPFLEEEGFREQVLAQIPLGRLGVVEDVMGAVVFLASRASSLITGESIAIDGGWLAQ